MYPSSPSLAQRARKTAMFFTSTIHELAAGFLVIGSKVRAVFTADCRWGIGTESFPGHDTLTTSHWTWSPQGPFAVVAIHCAHITNKPRTIILWIKSGSWRGMATLHRILTLNVKILILGRDPYLRNIFFLADLNLYISILFKTYCRVTFKSKHYSCIFEREERITVELSSWITSLKSSLVLIKFASTTNSLGLNSMNKLELSNVITHIKRKMSNKGSSCFNPLLHILIQFHDCSRIRENALSSW